MTADDLAPRPTRTVVVCLTDDEFREAVVGAALAMDLAVSAYVRRGIDLADLLGRDRPAVAIVDLALLGVEGVRTLARIREATPDTVLIVSSPLGGVHVAAIEMGAAQVVSEGDVAGVRAALAEAGWSSTSPSSPGSRITKAPLS